METPAVPALLIGTLFVEKGLITQEQLDLALAEQRSTGERLGEILVERFDVSRLDLASALAEQWAEYERQGTFEEPKTPPPSELGDLVAVSGEWEEADAIPIDKRPLGEIFLERGMVGEEDLEKALEEQRTTGRRLGEILVGQGNLTRLELASALADQWASFQKLRPPTTDNGIRPPAETPPVLPTPEVSKPTPTISAPPAELAGLRDRIDALGLKLEQLERGLAERPVENTASAEILREELAEVVSRVDELAAARQSDESQAPVELPVELATRIADLAAAIEEQTVRLKELAIVAESRVDPEELERRLAELSARPANGVDEVRSSLAALEETVTQLESGREAWRRELDSIADDLRGRVDSLQEVASRPSGDSQALSLRSDLDTLTARLDSLPEPPSIDALRAEVARLATRVDEVAAQQQPSGLDELTDTLAILSTRIDELPSPSDEWRDQIDALRNRFDELGSPAPALDELRAGLADLSGRIDAIPSPSEEWRAGLEALTARVEAMQDDIRVRLEQTEKEAPKRLGRGDVKQINRRIDELANELPEARRQIEAGLASLSARVAAIPAPSEQWRTQIETLAAKHDEVAVRLPEELQEVRERMNALSARIEQIPSPSEEWREQIDALRRRFEEVTGTYAPVLDGVRGELAELRERVATIPPPSDEWRHELAHVAENLRLRLERVESDSAEHAQSSDLTHIQSALDAVSGSLDALPAASEEWRVQIDALRGRLDEIVSAQPAGLEELRVEIATLGARIDGIPASSDEWRQGLAALEARLESVPDDVRVRLDRVEEDVAARADHGALAELVARLDELDTRMPDRLGELRSSLRQLADRVDAIAEPGEEWKSDLAHVAENLRARIERIESGLELRPGLDLVAGLREELQTLNARLETRLEATERLQAAHDERVGRLAELSQHTEGIEPRLREELTRQLESALAGRDDRSEELRRGIDEAARRIGIVEPALDRIVELERRLDQHGQRIEEIQASGPSAAEVAETINARLDASEAASVDLAATLDEQLAALERRLTAATGRADSDLESLRRELDDVRSVTVAGSAAADMKIDQLAEALRSEIAGVAAAAQQGETIQRLGALAADHAESLDALQAELHQYEQRLEERLAGKAAELAALRARFEQVDGSLAGIGDGARTAAAETDARLAGLDASTAMLDEKVAALEKSQVKRGDVRELRESVERIEQKVDAESATEDARVRAVEEALRDGLASLGSRLAETKSTYVEAGDSLRRSIERLGSAIRSADDEIASSETDAPRQIDLSSFLAFAPTPEGYRLVELPGPPPAIGETVEVSDFPPQVVTRLGVSPLPFDRRACAYLEPR